MRSNDTLLEMYVESPDRASRSPSGSAGDDGSFEWLYWSPAEVRTLVVVELHV